MEAWLILTLDADVAAKMAIIKTTTLLELSLTILRQIVQTQTMF
jgi:hypothetical protein